MEEVVLRGLWLLPGQPPFQTSPSDSSVVEWGRRRACFPGRRCSVAARALSQSPRCSCLCICCWILQLALLRGLLLCYAACSSSSFTMLGGGVLAYMHYQSSTEGATYCSSSVGVDRYISQPCTHRNSTTEWIEAEAQIKLEHKV